MIVEHEQQGQERAKYGNKLMEGLSEYLTQRYGRGFSVANLQSYRKFCLVYGATIQQTVSVEFKKINRLIPSYEEVTKKSELPLHHFKLSWSHYQILMRIENESARRFYEMEAVNQQWSVRQLRRQVGSSLYERLVLSNDRKKIKELANQGDMIKNPRDIFKSPYILEFTGLEQRAEYSESEFEQTLINNLQCFLLELGKGFLFEARQKRVSFDEESFYVDLVLYHRLLQCYVLIDIKVAKLKHQDLGQMLMYVNYFDRYVRQKFEKPTVGILLCSKRNDIVVELTLPEGSNIYASEYRLYLPDKTLLQSKLAQWIEKFEEEFKDAKD